MKERLEPGECEKAGRSCVVQGCAGNSKVFSFYCKYTVCKT